MSNEKNSNILSAQEIDNLIMDFRHDRNKDFLSNLDNILAGLKKLYLDEVAFIDLEESLNPMYSWKNNNLKITFLAITLQNVDFIDLLALVQKNDENNINFIDLTAKTNSFDFFSISTSTESRLQFLFNKELIDFEKENIIAAASASNTFSFGIKNWISKWVSNEYNGNVSELKLPSKDLIDFDSVSLHRAKFEFDDMLATLNNEQFSAELNEVLFGYNQKKWFIAAAGIGSLLEHLMHLTLKNYKDLKGLRKDPTAHDYINKFDASQHITFDSRQHSYINTLFSIRNSVSHHNDGFTGKEQCDQLLSGVKNIFTNYYIPSLAYYKAHQK
ncbi:hypothetical protein KAR50_05755 [Periweissella fabaria]|uniref:Apea-like HEPN domain-containing protein n=1 Tax=Periweissella fabaria TaxID=546157 RepID=A0ABN8BJW8_9LACO|nr:hypothetical protein [Periweissella fabaria]MCM0597347.1 hypothetical protein [Periweissella fabaria]CAH0416150.1 hypothetical protein WFA24289_00449 [Periweissella fabaria]